MRYVLDTDTLTLLRRRHPRVSARVNSLPHDEVAITVITVEEQLTGWYTLLRRAKADAELPHAYEQLAESVRALAALPMLPFSLEAAARCRELRGRKLKLGTMDLRIAAIVLEHGATVVTRNLRDFQRVPGLAVEDWSG